MSNLNAFTTINLLDAITVPIMRLSEQLSHATKACSAATSGMTAVANASAALQNRLNLGTVGATNGIGKATSAMEVPSIGQNRLEQITETTDKSATGFGKLTSSISRFNYIARDLSDGTLDPLFTRLSGIIDRVNEWCKSNPKLTGTIFASVAGVKALAIGTWGAIYAIGKMGNTVDSTIEGFRKWPENMESIKGALKRFWPFKNKASAFEGIEIMNPRAMRSSISPYSALGYRARPMLAMRGFSPLGCIGLPMGGGLRGVGASLSCRERPALSMRGFGPSIGGIGRSPILETITGTVIPPTVGGVGGVSPGGAGGLKGFGKLLAPLKTAGSGMVGVFKGMATAVLAPLKAVGAAILALGWPVLAVIAAIAAQQPQSSINTGSR